MFFFVTVLNSEFYKQETAKISLIKSSLMSDMDWLHLPQIGIIVHIMLYIETILKWIITHMQKYDLSAGSSYPQF